MKIIFTVLIAVPSICIGQWTQLGSNFNGTQADKLGSTHSVAIDSAGNTIAMGTTYNSNVFPNSGYAKVFDWNGSNWVQRGSDFIPVDSTLTGTGYAVDISADGITVAIGSPYGYNSLGFRSGVVRVFDWIGSNWVQRGLNIEGEGNANPSFSNDLFGSAIQLSASGNDIVIGGRGNTSQIGFNQIGGHVRIYHWNSSSWGQVGQDIDAPISFGASEFGYAVSINDAGSRVAIGARSHTGVISSNQERGLAQTFEFNGTNWIALGDTIFGTAAGDNLGTAVQLSGNGNTLAVGAPGANSFQGLTKIFDWNGTAWIQRGSDINGLNAGKSGTSIGLNNNGNIVAIGDPWANSLKGATRIFNWNGTSWQQLGNTISLAGNNIEALGSAVRLNDIGSRSIIGIPFSNAGGSSSGQVRVYENLSITSISNLTVSDQIHIYPNPSNNIINIESYTSILSYEILSLEGKTIYTENKEPGTIFQIDISKLNSGIYLLKLKLKENNVVAKFIIGD